MKDVTVGQLNPTLQLPEIPKPRGLNETRPGESFGDVLRDAIDTTNRLQVQSSQEIQRLMTGESQDLHATLIAVQRADLSFQMMMQVRNKLVQAYQEIMRMQV